MEEVLGRLKTLTPLELRQEILAAGLTCGPITGTTRTLFEKKLARTLLEKEGTDGTNGGSSAGEGEGHIDPVIEPSLTSEEVTGERVSPPFAEEEDSPTEPPTVFYGVCPVRDKPSGNNEKVHVFVDMKKAMKAVGDMPGARFKAFSTREEAKEFSKSVNEGDRSPGNTPDGSLKEEESLEGIFPPNLEKFSGPKTQDLTQKLRKAVEQGDEEAFSDLVRKNPRYLIGSGDNPTVVHEGCHYNVLHVAARENQAGIVRLILDTLENPKFMKQIYPEDQDAMIQERIRHIVDLYLNTPDKINNDTPLHFACKFGFPEVVNVLCSHPVTHTQRENKYNQKPSVVICERKNKTPEIKRKISAYLENRCYVPLLRDLDNSFQPVIGVPWSPGPLDVDFQPLGSGLEGSPIDPVLAIRAYVGPLSPTKADEFYRLWRTPPREKAEYFRQILKSDPDRGVERVGREMAQSLGHPWTEYWDFLESFVNLASEEGLKRLEEYLDRKDNGSPPQLNSNRGTDPPADSQPLSPSSEPQNKSFASPVCNLLPEFEKANLQDGSLKDQKTKKKAAVLQVPCETGPEDKSLDLANRGFWGLSWWSRRKLKQEQRREAEELSSTCSDDYLTADEGSECSDGPTRNRRDRMDSVSSYSSCESEGGPDDEDTTVIEKPSPTQGLFIQGDVPTRWDREVLCAVGMSDMILEKYPHITRWRNSVLAYPSSQRLSWPSPVQKSLEAQGLTPSRLSSPWHPRSGGFLSPGPHGQAQGIYTSPVLCRALFRSPK